MTERGPAPGVNPTRRRRARHLAVQAVYQWQLTGYPAAEIEAQFREDQPVAEADAAYWEVLVSGVIANCAQLDAAFSPHLSRPLKDLDQVDKAILRVGTFELLFRQDTPYRVVINEAIMLAKEFAAQDSHKFVNGVLDQVARRLQRQ